MRPRYNRSVPLPLLARLPRVTDDLLRALNEPGESLAPAALAIAGVEYPALDAAPYLQRLERMGEAAAGRLQRHESADAVGRDHEEKGSGSIYWRTNAIFRGR